MSEWMDDFFKTFGPKQGAVAAASAILGGIINQILTNRQKINEIKLTTEQEHFALTLDEAKVIRRELRESVATLEKNLSLWQQKYYDDINRLKEENLKLIADVAALKTQLMDIRGRGWIPKEYQESYL